MGSSQKYLVPLKVAGLNVMFNFNVSVWPLLVTAVPWSPRIVQSLVSGYKSIRVN